MMIKVAGFALMGILAMMIIPGDLDHSQNDLIFYGAATMVQKDALGQEIFSQTIHNRIVDSGEDFLLHATFQDSGVSDVANNQQVGTICISDAATPVVAETETASDFDGDNTLTSTNCIEDTTVTTTNGTGLAVIGALTFECGGINCVNDDTITAIGICQNSANGAGPLIDCAPRGSLFAIVDVTDTQLGASETVDITYTFDISSSGT